MVTNDVNNTVFIYTAYIEYDGVRPKTAYTEMNSELFEAPNSGDDEDE